MIGGQWRGRKLNFPATDGLRPTGDRIRETLFNWLAPRLPGARALDLFAGSGALGLEALSRGADEVVLLERQAQSWEQLRSNLALLGAADTAYLLHEGALLWLNQTIPVAGFDVVFSKSPFQIDQSQRTIDIIL